MSLQIDGTIYYSVSEVIEKVRVSRQTLWRWRKERRIPGGHRFRNRQIVFSQVELDAIEKYAKLVEPVLISETPTQMKLFKNGNSNGGNP